MDAAPDGYDGVRPLIPGALPVIADRSEGSDRYLVIDDQLGDHRLWLRGASALHRPAVLLPFDGAFDLRVDAMWRLSRMLRGQRAGPLPHMLQLTALRRARLILLLHALDFRYAGAGVRDIAAAMFDAKDARLPAIEWKSSATRRKVNRLLSDSATLMKGGYLDLLRGR